MSERLKYSLNGVYKCKNFTRHVENADSPTWHIGCASGFYWYIRFGREIINDTTFVYPFITSDGIEKIQVCAYFNILKKDGSSSFGRELKCVYLEWDEGCIGQCMDIGELLDEKNGYLNEGALPIEYGLQVDAEQGEDGIWRFNFHDKFFGWQNNDYMFKITFRRQRPVFSHKQIIKLYSTTIDANKNSARVPNCFESKAFHMCAQITHEVRLPMDAMDYRNVARVAFHFGFFNTVRYCENQLVIMETKLRINLFKLAVKCNMRCYLVHLLKQIETKKQLVKIMRRLALEKMSSEFMKAIVAKIFSL